MKRDKTIMIHPYVTHPSLTKFDVDEQPERHKTPHNKNIFFKITPTKKTYQKKTQRYINSKHSQKKYSQGNKKPFRSSTGTCRALPCTHR